MALQQVNRAVLDERETAIYLGVSPATVNDLASAGEIPHVMIAGNLRFRVKDLEEYLESKVTTNWSGGQERATVRTTQKQADLIREYCKINYLEPARARGEKIVKIRCGDVARAMGLSQRLPAVVAAIGANKFERLFNVVKRGEEGPGNGANKVFTFEVG
jgi:excisionase family DNA binding protein